MNFKRLEIPDVLLCTPSVNYDERGYFTESYTNKSLEDFLGYSFKFCQENETFSKYGVLRGLHFQQAPHSQTKLVRVLQGKIQDVVVDVRKDSPNFGKHISIILSAENKKQLLIPKGFAHGFLALSDNVKLIYKVDSYYNNQSERGIYFNDEFLNIEWNINAKDLIISEKDKIQPNFKDAEYFNHNTF